MKNSERIKFILSDPHSVIRLGQVAITNAFHLPVRYYPLVLQIYLEGICNLRCFLCMCDAYEKQLNFDMGNFWKLRKAINKARYISLTSCGEPLLSPHLRGVLEGIYRWNRKKNLIAIVTNGTLLSPSIARILSGHLADLTISLNAALDATYYRDTGGDLGKTVWAVRKFMGALSVSERHKVNLHMVAHKNNYAEIPLLVTLADALGIRKVRAHQFLVAQEKHLPLALFNIKEEYNEMVKAAKRMAVELSIDFSAPMFGKPRLDPCVAGMEAYIWADGRVAPCCYSGSRFVGNAYQGGFEVVWFGKEYNELRKYGMIQCKTCPKVLPFDQKESHIYPLLQEKL